jgi:hypothetical protein
MKAQNEGMSVPGGFGSMGGYGAPPGGYGAPPVGYGFMDKHRWGMEAWVTLESWEHNREALEPWEHNPKALESWEHNREDLEAMEAWVLKAWVG